MYQRKRYVDDNDSIANNESISTIACASPVSKKSRRTSSGRLYHVPEIQTRPVSCEHCACDVQYYEGDQNRTYSSSANSFIPTGAEIWPCGITMPRRDEDNCVDDEELSMEAMSFLNAQNDYFGPGGEYIADRIEQDFDLRWDYKRARQICIAHLDPTKMNLKVRVFMR